jgi:beta-glucosidase
MTLETLLIVAQLKHNSMNKKPFKCLCAVALMLLATLLWTAQKKTIEQKADSVLALMTLEEKVGQMNQYNGDWEATGPITKDGDKQNQIRKGMVGSMLNVTSVNHTRQLQEMAMQSRLKIPLLFGQDIRRVYPFTRILPASSLRLVPAVPQAFHGAAHRNFLTRNS